MTALPIRILSSRIGWLVIIAFLPACAASQSDGAAPPSPPRSFSAAEAQLRRNQTVERLHQLGPADLAQELARDSLIGREPFNSFAFVEASRSRERAAGLNSLLVASDRSSLLTLLALRRAAPELYRAKAQSFKVSVLVDALQNARYFNTFGLPHLHWEEAAQALIEEGEVALNALKPLLVDERPAPVWGSEDYSEYRRYDFRVQDYAYSLIKSIRREPVVLPTNRQERLTLIERLR
jgi:hypothetical protein